MKFMTKFYDNEVQALFDALLTSKNQEFIFAISTELRNWEKGEEISFEVLKATANQQFNNISAPLKR